MVRFAESTRNATIGTMGRHGSTGPRTRTGKARAAHNGVTHGLYTQAMVIRHGPLAEKAADAARLHR